MFFAIAGYYHRNVGHTSLRCYVPPVPEDWPRGVCSGHARLVGDDKVGRGKCSIEVGLLRLVRVLRIWGFLRTSIISTTEAINILWGFFRIRRNANAVTTFALW